MHAHPPLYKLGTRSLWISGVPIVGTVVSVHTVHHAKKCERGFEELSHAKEGTILADIIKGLVL